MYAKATRKPVRKARGGERASEFGDEIHSDVWGPAPNVSQGGKRYYVTFTDDKTRLTAIYFLKSKDETFDAYKKYEAWAETQKKAHIKVLHSDRGGEYMGKAFIVHLKSRGTVQKLTVHDTPEHNGVAERRNRTIVERVRALLHASHLPRKLWPEAARHVVWLLNRTSTKAVDGMTPYEAVYGQKPDLRGVREWGEMVWVQVKGGSKLGGRVREARWLGFDDRSENGTRVYYPDNGTVRVERNVWVDKTQASRQPLEGDEWDFVVGSNVPPPPPVVEAPPPPPVIPAPAPVAPAPVPAPVRAAEPPVLVVPAVPEVRPKRVRKPSALVKDLLSGAGSTSNRASDPVVPTGIRVPEQIAEPAEFEGEGQADQMMAVDWADEYAMAAEMSDAEALEPRSLAEARRRPDWPLWEAAIKEEIALLDAQGTWELVDPPADANIVGSKWVFKAKKDAAGNVVRYKARLVAQGFSQAPGVDYFDVYAPVAKLASIRGVLAKAAELDWEIHQVDIKGAYLNGELTADEQIYMRQPPGFPAPSSSGKVCHLLKTLYGLKQSGRRWYQKLVDILVKSMGFQRCESDQ